MKKTIPIIIILFVVLGTIGFGVYHYFSAKTKFNDSYVNGNSAGNLYNGGLFCENGGTIFFSNPSDQYRLYSMDLNGDNLKKLCDDTASFINADSNYVYYIRSNTITTAAFSFLNRNTDSLCRIDRNGSKKILILDEEPSMHASLVGNYIYYLRYDSADATSLYKIRIDGNKQEQVDKNPYFTCSASGPYIYYNGLERDHFIWRRDTQTDEDGILYGGNCWMPIVVNDATAYFMDCDNNYKLASADLATEEKTILSNDRVDCYNVYGNYIYFQRNDSEEPALCRMRTDGTEYEIITRGNYAEINVASNYVYFRDFRSGTMYRASTESGSAVEIYNPGKIVN